MKDIGDKHVVLSGFRIPITNTSELNGAILCFGASELDGMVRGQTLGFKHLATFHHPVVYPLLHPSDKESELGVGPSYLFAISR